MVTEQYSLNASVEQKLSRGQLDYSLEAQNKRVGKSVD